MRPLAVFHHDNAPIRKHAQGGNQRGAVTHPAAAVQGPTVTGDDAALKLGKRNCVGSLAEAEGAPLDVEQHLGLAAAQGGQQGVQGGMGHGGVVGGGIRPTNRRDGAELGRWAKRVIHRLVHKNTSRPLVSGEEA